MSRQKPRDRDLDGGTVLLRGGATFRALADRYGIAEPTRRKLLVTSGAVPRLRGKQTIEIATPDLIIVNWRAGLSCRAIARKQGLKDHMRGWRTS